MAMINVEIWDSTGAKKEQVELPDDASVNRIVAVLIDKLNLPRNNPQGQPMSYKFHHKSSGKQIQDDETLRDAGVEEGDILRVVPEIIAGMK